MNLHEKIDTSKYTYDLPAKRIARYPLPGRSGSKLLVYNNGIRESVFMDIDTQIPAQSRIFFNNTRVIHARLQFRKQSGAQIEIFCLAPHEPSEYQLAFTKTRSCTWKCMIGNLKKWKYEELTLPLVINGIELTLTARKKGAELDMHLINFSWDQDIIFSEIIEKAGQIPIPPYLRRESETSDETSYQTVYSKFNGSVAAPTAGLHFTDEVLNKLRARGNELHELTLHVGAGTFRQIKTSDARQHEMHREIFTICTSTLETLATSGSTIIATGTTTLRTLESLYWLGVKLLEGETLPRVLHQWEYTQLPSVFSPRDAFKALYESVLAENLSEYTAETGIMIVPGYEFKVVDGLITNFHQPDSTLLMLVAAFLGEEWRNVYDYALSHEFRFLSYGDSSLLWR